MEVWFLLSKFFTPFCAAPCQSVTQVTARERILSGVCGGHTLGRRGCNTTNPATLVLRGVGVGHFDVRVSGNLAKDGQEMIKDHGNGNQFQALRG